MCTRSARPWISRHRNIAGPTLRQIVHRYGDRIGILAHHQVGNQSLQIRTLDVGLPPCAAVAAEVPQDKIDGFVLTVRDDRRIQGLRIRKSETVSLAEAIRTGRIGSQIAGLAVAS